MKKIVVASDTFKGSLSSSGVADAVEKAVLSVFPGCEVVKTAVADGGEGTAEAMIAAKGGRFVSTRACDPLMRPVEVRYGITGSGRTAVIDLAAASGLTLLTPGERDPLRTTTYGTGQLVSDAVSRGCRLIIIGCGGSATNDAGTGLLQALGYVFTDRNGCRLGCGGGILGKIAGIRRPAPALPEGVRLIAAYDITNPFYGPEGAAAVYSPQKGAGKEAAGLLDLGMESFCKLIHGITGIDLQAVPGSGAAGGTAGTLHALANAGLCPGAELVLHAAGFEDALAGAGLVITGEGKADMQTLSGKTPFRVMKAAAKAGVPTILLAGIAENEKELLDAGFAGIYPITPPGQTPCLDPAVTSANITERLAGILKSQDHRTGYTDALKS